MLLGRLRSFHGWNWAEDEILRPGHLTDEPVTEQPHLPGLLGPAAGFIVGLGHLVLLHAANDHPHRRVAGRARGSPGAVRVDHLHGQPRDQQPAARHRGRQFPRRQRERPAAPAALCRRGRGHDRGHRIPGRRPGRGWQQRIGSRAHNTPVKAARSACARAVNRRSQPRTVAAGRPARSATRRCPSPAAAPASATPITPAASARRTSTLTGSNTCVAPHSAHLARRGRNCHRPAPASRTTRRRACPHPRSRPPHPGHPSRPDDSLRRRAGSVARTALSHFRW
jgi:hypothetical protein